MSEPAQKCENNEAILSKTILKNCLFPIKHPIIAFLAFKGNLEFPDFHQKKIYNIDYSEEWVHLNSKYIR